MRTKCVVAVVLLLAVAAPADELRPETRAAFDTYVQEAEARIMAEQSSARAFLRLDQLSPVDRRRAEQRLRAGEVMIEASPRTQVPHGLIHDWTGTVFIPGATIKRVFSVVQDYDHLTRYYRPQVVSSHLMARHGDRFDFTMRLRQHKVITVVLDVGYDVLYGSLDAEHWYSQSRSTRVMELDDGRPANEPRGFLWAMNTYWRFVEAADGVYVQCEAISLTRDIPTGLGWLVGPFVQSIPRDSLQFTLNATRKAVLATAAVASSRSFHDHQ